MIARSHGARLAASVIVAGALVLTGAGCTFIAPQATTIQYDPADGVSADLGNVLLRDVLAVVGDDGKTVSLVMTAVNMGTSNEVLNISINDKATPRITVLAGSSVSVGRADSREKAIATVSTKVMPGSNVDVYVQAGSADGKLISVPVFDSSSSIYGNLAP